MSTESVEPFTLRAFRPELGAGVRDLIGRVYAEYGQVLELDTLDSDLLEIEALYTAPHAFGVHVQDGRVLATTAVKRTSDERAELKRVFLDPDLRGRGHGRTLVDWSADRARSAGARWLDIWTDVLFTRAHGLYAHLEARDTGRTRELGGRNAVVERHFELEL